MKRWTYLIYGVGCYVLFFGTYAYLMGFIGNAVVPKTIDGETTTPWGVALVVNVLLLTLFGLQHSIMARPAFKRVWTRWVAVPIERSTYILLSCVALGLLVWFWQPMNFVLWDVQQPTARSLLWALFVIGWLMVPTVSLMINHFDLFGMRQVWLHWQDQAYEHLPFRTPYLYAYVRHPLYVGWAIAFWATPTMTVGHLLFAAYCTGYMATAAIIEERDLIAHFGHVYQDYARRVPRYLPRWKPATALKQKPALSESRN